MNDGTAPGNPAPIGSARSYDLGKQPRKKKKGVQRRPVTKDASFDVGVLMGLEKVAAITSGGGSSIPDNADTVSGEQERKILGDDDPLMKEPGKRKKRYLRRKLAENASQSNSGDVKGAETQTQGEGEASTRGGEITGNVNARVKMQGRVESTGRPGSGGGKNRLPIWIRYAKNLQSVATRNGGDKAGARPSDKQMETPKIPGSA